MCSGNSLYSLLCARNMKKFDIYKCSPQIQVKVNPSGGVSSLVFICQAIASWHVSEQKPNCAKFNIVTELWNN